MTDGGDYKCKTKQAKLRNLPTRRTLSLDNHGSKRTWRRFFVHGQGFELQSKPASSRTRELKESLQKLKVETEEMSVENYTAHIDNHRCLTASMKGLNFMHNEMNSFQGKIAMVRRKAKDFWRTRTSLVDKHKDFQSTLQKYPELLQLLEIPQLLNVCIKRQSFEDAIRLAAFVEKLVKRHAVLYGVITPEMANRRAVEQKTDHSVRNGFDLILSIFVEVQKIIQSMRAELIQTLGGTLTLPLCVKTVGYLRRVFTLINKFDAIAYLNVDHDPSSMNTIATLNVGDLKLEKIFLESRGNYLKAELAKLKQDNASEYIIQSIERRRLILCDIVSQFNAIFADYDGGTASVSASEGERVENSFRFFASRETFDGLDNLSNR